MSETLVKVNLSEMRPAGNGTETIDQVIEITNAFLEVGQFAFPEVEKTLEVIAGFGKLIQALSGVVPEEEDPVMKKLGELEGKIDMLANKMEAKFADLKAFMTEIKFNGDVVQPTTILMQYMRDSFHHPSQKGTDNFLDCYNKNKPLQLAYTVMSLLKQDSTNPLKKAMEADLIKTSTTFDKWHNTISAILGQFLFIEAYASGVQGSKDAYDRDRMKDNSKKVFADMDRWRDEYQKSDGYWKGLKQYVQEFQEQTSGLSHSDRADKLIGILGTIMAPDALYLIISDSSPNINDFGIYKGADDQIMESYERAGCNIIVYRSKKANTSSLDDFWAIQHAVEDCREGRLQSANTCSGFPGELRDNPIKNAGMILTIWTVRHPEVRSCLTPGHQWGPGYWNKIIASETRWYMKKELMLVAGML